MNEKSSPSSPPTASAARWTALAVSLLAFILVPFVLFEGPMNAASVWWIARERPPASAAVAVGVLLAADVVLPVPSSLVSTASGALFGWLGGALVSWLGMTAGTLTAWGLGRSVGRGGLRKLVGEAELVRAERLAARYGTVAVVLARPVPVLAEASVLLAAACGMPFRRFIALAALSNAGISLAYAGIGALASDVSSFLLAFVGACALPAVAMAAARRWRRSERPGAR